ncbi:MFS transporter [Brevibacillus daliensis]|uniref:MFS transporter n=1 Tax=Brevibacillus daliensis TaxID=2892995 RepID=UPI001E46DC42|nr:MFS transporter [Brevibacillus daliensis]
MEDMSALEKPEEKVPSNFKRLFAIRDYRNLIAAQLISNLGDGVYAIGLIWLMKLLTNSSIQMSILLAAEIIPLILLGIFAGVVVDMGNKRRIMMIADVGRGIILLAIAGLLLAGWLQPWMLIVGAIILSSFSAYFTPARAVTVRTIVPEELIRQAQSISQGMQTVVGIAGPAIGALLLSFDLSYVFLFNGISFFISLYFIWLIKREELNQNYEGKMNYQKIKQGLTGGFRAILGEPILRDILIYMMLVNFILAPTSILFPLYVSHISQLASIEIALVLGILLGSLLVGLMSKWKLFLALVTGLLLIMIPFGLLSIVTQYWLMIGCAFVAGIGSSIANVTLQTLFMIKVPLEVLGRASSMMRVLLESFRPLAILATGSLVALYSVRDIFLAIAVFGILLIGLMWVNPSIRKNEEKQYVA